MQKDNNADIQKNTVEKEIANDKEVIEKYFKTIHKKNKELQNLKQEVDNKLLMVNDGKITEDIKEKQQKIQELKKEVAAGRAYIKQFMLIASSNVTIKQKNTRGNYDIAKAGAKEKLIPVATLINHGSRVLFEGDPIAINAIPGWLNENPKYSGEQKVKPDGETITEAQQATNKAIDDNIYNKQTTKIIPQVSSSEASYNSHNSILFRRTSTHDCKFEDGEVKEVKLSFLKAAWKYLKNYFTKYSYANQDGLKEYGFNIALNGKKADGAHGHILVGVKTFPKKQGQEAEKAILYLGHERYEPSNSNHSKTGRSEKESASGGVKRSALQRLSGANEYILPDKYDGAVGAIQKDTTEKIDEFLKDYLKNDYKPGLGSVTPQENFQAFKENCEAKQNELANAKQKEVAQSQGLGEEKSLVKEIVQSNIPNTLTLNFTATQQYQNQQKSSYKHSNNENKKRSQKVSQSGNQSQQQLGS